MYAKTRDTRLVAGVLVFLITCIRFYILLKKGKYQRGTNKENQRRYFEKKSLMPMAIVGGLGVVYIIQFAARNGYTDINDLVFILLGPLLFYVMIFVLPEQLVLLYCKFRFDSFNYSFEKDPDGVLKPMGIEKG